VVLGPAELGAHRQLEPFAARPAEIEPRNLVAGVRLGLDVVLAPRELEVVDAGFLGRLAERRRERLFPGLDDALREVPVSIRAKQQEPRTVRRLADDDEARREPAFGAAFQLFSSGKPLSRHACIPPSSAAVRRKPSSRSVAAASVEILPNSQTVTIRAVGSLSSSFTRSSSWPRGRWHAPGT